MSDDREDQLATDTDDDPTFIFDELEDRLDVGERENQLDVDESGAADDPREESYFSDLLSTLSGGEVEPSWDTTAADESIGWGGDEILPDSKSQAIVELLRGAPNVLLLGPLLCPADYEVGATLMGGHDGEPFNLLLVTFSQGPDERFRVCRAYLDTAPAETRIIGVGSQTRSGSSGPIETPDGSITVDVVSNPEDLKRIGIKINQTLNRWDESGRRTVVCFHSLSALLQYVNDERRIFRFLSILRGRIQQSDGHVHYHMEDGAHDEGFLNTIRTLFDAVITYDENGSVSIDI